MALSRDASRRLLSALADSAPAFTPAPAPAYPDRSRIRRLLSALADSTPAFRQRNKSDEYTARPAPVASTAASPSGASIHVTALGEFADNFAQLSIQVRLTARRWFPRRELANLRFIAQAAFHAQLLKHLLDQTFWIAPKLKELIADAEELSQDVNVAHVHALDQNLAVHQELDQDRSHDLDRYVELFRAASEVKRDLDDGRQRVDDLFAVLDRDRSGGLDPTYAVGTMRAPLYDLTSTLLRGRDSELRLIYGLTRYRSAIHSYDLAVVSSFLDAIGRTRETNNHEHVVADIIEAIDQMEKAITKVMDADLSHVDLTGIPLDGVRWSTGTRWPAEWVERIRQNSVALAPDVYEIRSWTIGVDATIDA